MGVIVDERWSTKKVDHLVKMFNKTGVIPDKHPYFKRKLGKRKADINFSYTREELIELSKCEDDIVYFANNYCKILTDGHGRKILKEVGGIRDYQEDLLRMFQNNQFNIVLASRQIGKSITVAIYVCWYILFNDDANILLLSETGTKAKDLLKKIKDIQDYLPFYMQVGLVYDSTQRRIYDNGCTLISENTTENSGVSGSYQFVYWDEMALLEPQVQDKIFTGVFPTMASFGDKAKFIITSTPRGRNNKFHSIWHGATSEPDSPEYIPFSYAKVMWYQVKGRDKNWEMKERAIMGDDGFDREYGLSFDADGSLLIDSENKIKINENYKKYIRYTGSSKFGGILSINPDFDIQMFSDPDKSFHISIDIAGGKNRDYTVFNFFELKPKTKHEIDEMDFIVDEMDFFKLEQVAVIRSNVIKTEIMAMYLYDFIDTFRIPPKLRITIELNFEGKLFLKHLFDYKGKRNVLNPIREDLVVEYPVNMNFDSDNVKYEYGIIQNAKTKQNICKTINNSIKNNDIVISHSVTIEEGLSFGLNKKGNYQGLAKNDDCFMTVLNISNYKKTDEYEEQINELMELLDSEQLELINSKIGSEDEDEDDNIY